MKLTPAQFRHASEKTRMRGQSLEGARMVLVKGTIQAEAARVSGVSAAAVWHAVRRIVAAHEAGTPHGCEWITVCVPSSDVAEFRKLAENGVELIVARECLAELDS